MARLQTLKELIAGYCTAVREAHTSVQDTLKHSDSLLNWTVGLLGAGLFAAPSFLSSLGVNLGSHRAGLSALSPWVVGILCGVAGRLFALELIEANNLYVGLKLHAIEALVLRPKVEADEVGAELVEIMNDAGDHGKRLRRTKRFQWWTRFFYYATYLALALGIVAVAALAALGERRVLLL